MVANSAGRPGVSRWPTTSIQPRSSSALITLLLTATPRIYGEVAKAKAQEMDAAICSMDNPAFYGEEFYRIGFGKAVEKLLLSDDWPDGVYPLRKSFTGFAKLDEEAQDGSPA